MNIDQTTITSVAAILSSKELLQKILGPSADYIGGEIKNLIEKCNINLGNIFFKTQKKLGDKINEAGQVSPRVLKNIIDEGKFCEDEIQTEYYGGLLASARTPIGRDDRPVFILNLVKSMSVYQLRLHYLFYYSVFNLFRNSPINLGTELNVRIKIALNDYDKAMDFSEKKTEIPFCYIPLWD